MRVEMVTTACVRVGAGVGVRAGALCEQSWSCWAGVGLNFRPLLYAAQHANKKNRDPICMLGWSCSKKVVDGSFGGKRHPQSYIEVLQAAPLEV